jgi:hypothetical protein
VLVTATLGYLVVVANVFALTDYPYGNNPESLVKIHTAIAATPSTVRPGDKVALNVTVENGKILGVAHVTLTIALDPGLRLIGPPAFTRGSGCQGTTTIVCDLDTLGPAMSTAVGLVAQLTEASSQRITARTTVDGGYASKRASLTIEAVS